MFFERDNVLMSDRNGKGISPADDGSWEKVKRQPVSTLNLTTKDYKVD
jgi:hypothetical protein